MRILGIALVALAAFLFAGCCNIPPIEPPKVNDTVIAPPRDINASELAERHGCDFEAEYWGNFTSSQGGEYAVYECTNTEWYDDAEKPYVYMIDRHPGPPGLVTYVFVSNGVEHKIENVSEIAAYFGEIRDEKQARAYAVLHEGLWVVSSVQQAPGEKSSETQQADGWLVKILHESRNMCPCYGGYYSTEYLVRENGVIEAGETKNLYSYGPSDTGCIC